jgi:hypothetical protein
MDEVQIDSSRMMGVPDPSVAPGRSTMIEATKLLNARLEEIMKPGGPQTSRTNQNMGNSTHEESSRSFLPIDELAMGMQPQVWGMQGDTYITPFVTTVFYHDLSVFETVIANMVKTAQLIIIPEGGIKCVKYSYLSPNVLMFDATTEDIDYCISEGFQMCTIFRTELTTSANTILTETDKFGKGDGDATPTASSDVTPSYIRYADVYHPEDLYPLLMTKTTAAFMCELAMVTMGTFECASNITPARGKYFLAALAEGNIGSKLASILESYTGFEKIEKLIIRGKISIALYKKQFTEQLETKQCYSLKYHEPVVRDVQAMRVTIIATADSSDVSDVANTSEGSIHDLRCPALDQDVSAATAPRYLRITALAGNCEGGPFVDWEWIRTTDTDIIIFYLYASEWQITLVPITMSVHDAISAIIPLDAVGMHRIRVTNSNYITLTVSSRLAEYLLPFLT